jgi:hypothetical protein
MKKYRGPEIYVFFISHTFIKTALFTIFVFLSKSPIDPSRRESAGYHPTGSASIVPSMHPVKNPLFSGRADTGFLRLISPGFSATTHVLPTIDELLRFAHSSLIIG